ncbi:MAG: Lipid A core-O-antigen ligase-like protein enyme [Candidatus Woesebacteria bacterium GW2011_GWA1_45_8]|uniref:Lipid A core-O-antigen ligase-like protein enyme n=1 Tax=Candidatus Woesebacteria bacterium GW2011_GWA1_45_8 TaxID=1618559 RepID=A0A0G1MW45_9BACT|nr:MAG: Lipid A core-O-antigen ligase-like protein enyme [Candidatus Woesebacteria bacterium GW2011_GWA1_45_8]
MFPGTFLKIVRKRVLQLFILLLPTQLGYHFWPKWAYVFGVRVDYLSPTLYLTDILAAILLVLWIHENRKRRVRLSKNNKLVILSILAFLNVVFALVSQLAILKWIKIGELYLIARILMEDAELKIHEDVVIPLTISTTLILVLAFLQIVLQRSVGGVLYFLGERSFNSGTPGISLYSLFGSQLLRPYATFSHPNSMAGFAGAVFLFFLGIYKKLIKARPVLFIGMASCLGILVLSVSRNAIAALILALVVYLALRRKVAAMERLLKVAFWLAIILGVGLPVVSNLLLKQQVVLPESISQRLVLADLAGRLFSEKPILGFGANYFIPVVTALVQGSPISWMLQPVHNVPLLFLVEAGAVSFIVFTLIAFTFLKTLKKKIQFVFPVLVFILLTASFDHYWFTLQQNQLLLAVILGIFSRKNGKEFLLN